MNLTRFHILRGQDVGLRSKVADGDKDRLFTYLERRSERRRERQREKRSFCSYIQNPRINDFRMNHYLVHENPSAEIEREKEGRESGVGVSGKGEIRERGRS